MHEELKGLTLHLVLSITDAQADKILQQLMEQANIPLRFQCRGQGTATSEVLRLCGLGETTRTLTMCVLPHAAVHRLFEKLNEAMHLRKRGKGVAVSIPLTGVQRNLAQLMNRHTTEDMRDKIIQEAHTMAEGSSYTMIVAAVNQGYSDEVIDTARSAGAMGGTILRGRRRGLDEATRFWGIFLQEEQEILLVIVPRTRKREVMAAIGKNHGVHSPAQGIVLSLPVDDVIGLET